LILEEGHMASLTPSPQSVEDTFRNHLLSMTLGVAQTQLLRVAAELGIADLVKDGPRSIEALATETGTEVSVLARVLRGLAGIGVLAETGPQLFAGTPLATLLQANHPNSLRDYAKFMGSVWLHQTWPHLPESVRTGGSAFEALFGQPVFEYMQGHPSEAAEFNAAMSAITRQESVVLQAVFDFSTTQHLVDVGGGLGLLLATLLRAYPSLHGTLLELPRMAEGARAVLEPEVAEGRCQIVAGDFLASVPAGGDVYILKRVLMDHDDAQARTLLRNIREAMHSNGRVLIAEPDLASQYGTSFDMLLLVVSGTSSRIRTEAEMRELFTSAGLTLTRSLAAPPTLRLVEGTPS
jgi:hypothetical protein